MPPLAFIPWVLGSEEDGSSLGVGRYDSLLYMFQVLQLTVELDELQGEGGEGCCPVTIHDRLYTPRAAILAQRMARNGRGD